MSFETAYLVGRPKDLNSTMSLNLHGILIVLPNYTEVQLDPPDLEDLPGDQAVFRLRVHEEKLRVKEETDRTGRRTVARLWEGPENRRDLPQLKVSAFISLAGSAAADQTPIDPEKSDLVDSEKIRQANEDLMAKVGDLTTKLNEVESALQSPSVAFIKDVVRHAPDEVLEALPHIGPETIDNLRSWSAEGLSHGP